MGLLLAAAVATLIAAFVGWGEPALFGDVLPGVPLPGGGDYLPHPPRLAAHGDGPLRRRHGGGGPGTTAGFAGLIPPDPTQTLASAFIVALFLDGWVANAVLSVRVKR